MKEYSIEIPEWTMGLDLGDRYSYYKLLDKAGEVVEEGRIKTTPEILGRNFRTYEPMRVVMEAGTHSPWVSRLLEECGHEVLVANPRKLRLIYENTSKDDRVDAEYLARLGRLDPQLLAPLEHRNEQAQADLQVIRSRETLVKTRSQLINHVRGSVKTLGERLSRCSTESFHKKVSGEIPEAIQEAMVPILDIIARITSQIRVYDRTIEEWGEEKYPEIRVLRQIHGVGPVTAAAFILTLEDPARFKKSRSVGPFLGLCSGRDQSGGRDPQLRITKEGDPYLRRLLVNCGQYILGPFGVDCDLRRHGQKIDARGGKNAKKRAVVAVARKLSVLLHQLWVSGAVYDPFYNSKRANAYAQPMIA